MTTRLARLEQLGDLQQLDKVSKVQVIRMRLFYKNLGQKRFEVDAVGKEACFATTQGAIQIRHGSGDANVINGQSRT